MNELQNKLDLNILCTHLQNGYKIVIIVMSSYIRNRERQTLSFRNDGDAYDNG